MSQPPLCARRAARWHKRAPRLIDVPPHAVIPRRGRIRPRTGVRPSIEYFRRNDASAPPAESLPAPKIFLQKKGYPLWDRTIFGQVFVRGGMINTNPQWF